MVSALHVISRRTNWLRSRWTTVAALIAVCAALILVSVIAYRPFAAPRVPPGPPVRRVLLTGVSAGQVGQLAVSTQEWQFQDDTTVPARDRSACTGRTRAWRNKQPTIWVIVAVARCASLEAARDLQWYRVAESRSSEGVIQLPPAVPFAFQGRGSPFAGWPPGDTQEVDFRRGDYYAEVAAYVADSRGADATTLVRRVAVAQSRRLPGTPGPGAQSFPSAVIDGVVGSAVGATLLFVCGWALAGYVRRKIRETRAGSPGPEQDRDLTCGVEVVDVSGAASRASRSPRWGLGFLLTAVLLASYAAEPRWSAPVTALYGAFAALTAAVATWQARCAARYLRPRNRRPISKAEAAWCLLMVAAVAGGLLAFALATQLQSPSVTLDAGRVDPSIVMDDPLWRWTASLPVRLVIINCFGTAALLLAAVFGCSRQARRVTARTDGGCDWRERGLRIAYQADQASQRLPVRTSAMGRPGLAERLTLRQFEAFHQVATRLLSAFGSVTVAESVEGLSPDASVFVVNAVPSADYEPPEPELSTLSRQGRLADALLIFPPLSGYEVHARWERFQARNAEWAPPREVGKYADRLLLMRADGAGGWRAWHADVKSEWAYARACAQAVCPGVAAAPASAVTLADAAPAVSSALRARPQRERSPLGDHRRRKPTATRRRWGRVLAALVLTAVIAANVVAAAATAPAPGNVSAIVSQELLQPGAIGDKFTLIKDVHAPKSTQRLLGQNVAACGQRYRIWANSPRHLMLEVKLTGCWPPGVVEASQARLAHNARLAGTVVSNQSGIPYATQTSGTARVNGFSYRIGEVMFRSGPVIAAVIVYSRSPVTGARAQLLMRVAREQLHALPDPAGPGFATVDPAELARPLGRWIINGVLWIVIAISLWSWLSRRRPAARGEGPPPVSTTRVAAIDVTGPARRAAWLARGRFTLRLAGGYLLLVCLITPPPTKYAYVAVGLVLLTVAQALRSRGLKRSFSARRRGGVLTGRRTARAVCLVMLSLIAAAIAIGMAVSGIVALALGRSGAMLASGRLDPGLLAPGLSGRIAGALPLRVFSYDFFGMTIAAAVAVPVSYMAARRVAALTADEISRGDDDPDSLILYLRNFADDDIRMSTSRLSRNSFVERIAVYRRERFEEVIVRHLSQFGAVIAVNPAGLDRPPIGAARMNMDNSQWQEMVGEKIRKVRLIVVGAAPQWQTQGLSWELSEIREAGALTRTLLVLPPLPAQMVRARWAAFRAMTPSYGLSPELARVADHYLVLADPDGSGRWRVWHSRRRTEWTYAIALREAAAALLAV